ncbi:MAG: hypothetical protein JJT94_04960 [Bernardetiaceae bacterium]|nr:hypothetical protein [Bernardetiaceae bacterium]
MDKIKFRSRYGAKIADRHIKVEGSNPASTKHSEKCQTFLFMNKKEYVVLTQSDVQMDDDGKIILAGYGIWVFLGDEPKEEFLIGKMRNVAEEGEAKLDVRSTHEEQVMIIIDFIRAIIDKESRKK